MSRIHFITIRADKLAAVLVAGIILLGLTGYFIFLGAGMREATPVPRALLLRTLPVSTMPTPPPPTAAIGAPAPDFTLAALGGNSTSLSTYKGRPVLLYFWASWCSFCRDDMPELLKVQEANKDSGLTIVAINLLEKEELVKSFANQFGVRIPMLMDSEGAVSSTYLVRATPTYVFIDKNGLLKAQVVGRPRPAVFERNLALITEAAATEPNQSKTSQSAPTSNSTSPNKTDAVPNPTKKQPTQSDAPRQPSVPAPTPSGTPTLTTTPAPNQSGSSSQTTPNQTAPNQIVTPGKSVAPDLTKTPTPAQPSDPNPTNKPKR